MPSVTPADLLNRALALRRHQCRVRMWLGLLATVLVIAVAHAVLLLLATLQVPLSARLAFLACAVAAGVVAAAWAIWLGVTTPSADRVAVLVEERFPELQDRFVTAVEIGLAQQASGGRWTAASTSSPLLAQRLADQAEAAIQGRNLRQAIDTRPLCRLACVVGAATIGLAVSGALFPSAWAGILREPPARPAVTRPDGPNGLHLAPLTRPSIADVSVTLDYPAYTRQAPETRTADFESISAIVGTRVTIAGTVAGDEVSAALRLNAGDRPLAIAPDGRASARFTLAADAAWQLRVSDPAGRSMSTPLCRVKALRDRPPEIALLEPGKSIAIPDPRPVRLEYRAQDDWGLGGIALEYRAPEQTQWTSVPLSEGGGRVLADAWSWDLRPLRLIRGQSVSYRLTVRDNDTVSGPKTARSATYTVTIGAEVPAEVADAAAAEEAAQRESGSLEELQQEAEELGRQLDETISALEKGQMTEGERSQRAAELNEAQRRVAEQADKVSRALAESERQAKKEGLAPELQEKMRELHDLLQETMNQDLVEALKEIEQALQSMNPDDLKQSLQRARESQQDFAEQLEQAIELLKRARLEREVARAAEQARKLAEAQAKLNEQREQLTEGESAAARRQAERQEELRRQEAGLEGDLQDLAQRAAEVSRQVAEQLSKTQTQLQQAGVQGAMQDASSQLQQGSPAGAAQPQQTALNALSQAASALSEMQAGMGMQSQGQLARIMQELTRDALYLSRQQERALQATEAMDSFNAGNASQGKTQRESVRRDQETLEAATRQLGEKLRELSEQTPVIDPALARGAGETADLMAQAGREAAGGAVPQASLTQRRAMRGMNELAEELIRANQEMQQSAAAMAMQQAMQQLQSLAQQQGNLNQQTQQAQSGGQQPRKEGGRGDLADEQARIREALERLLDKVGKPSALSDQLGDVPGDMRDVEQELRADRPSNETIERQQQVLHRMLDAQRSVYRKDQQRRQRIAERPKPFRLPPSPPELTPRTPPQAGPGVTPGEDAELPLDFEDIVRQYFRALAEVR